jgi:hypothetical protein
VFGSRSQRGLLVATHGGIRGAARRGELESTHAMMGCERATEGWAAFVRTRSLLTLAYVAHTNKSLSDSKIDIREVCGKRCDHESRSTNGVRTMRNIRASGTAVVTGILPTAVKSCGSVSFGAGCDGSYEKE